jgi:hypothetical protein
MRWGLGQGPENLPLIPERPVLLRKGYRQRDTLEGGGWRAVALTQRIWQRPASYGDCLIFFGFAFLGFLLGFFFRFVFFGLVRSALGCSALG